MQKSPQAGRAVGVYAWVQGVPTIQAGREARACEPAQRNAGVWIAGKGGERASSAEELTNAGKGRMQGAGIWRKTWDPISQVPKVSSWGSV